MDDRACRATREDLRAVVSGEAAPAERAEAETHLAACDACSREAAREARLLALLQRLPAAPVGAAPSAPSLPDLPAGPPAFVAAVRRWGSVAAAAVLAIGAWVAVRRHAEPADPRETAAAAAFRFVDVSDRRPAWDDRTIALALGAEFVAARLPAEDR